MFLTQSVITLEPGVRLKSLVLVRMRTVPGQLVPERYLLESSIYETVNGNVDFDCVKKSTDKCH